MQARTVRRIIARRFLWRVLLALGMIGLVLTLARPAHGADRGAQHVLHARTLPPG